ncbi:MAG: phenylphosphate carboxylase subunit delta [Planctomycetota bacterium]|nr:MAG: phenylphosphate carboxylase subunit delta [Planctomycetota bacterium]
MALASRIELLITDVDGVWTDGGVTLHSDGSESVTFCVLDGYGVRQIQRAGLEVVIVSGRKNLPLEHRAKILDIQELHMGVADKGPVVEAILQKRDLSAEAVAVVGDDLPDLPMFDRCGLCFAPANAVQEVQNRAHYVTQRRGGEGALREICDLLLLARRNGGATTPPVSTPW